MNSVAGVLSVKITNMSDVSKTAAEKVLDFNVDTDIEAITAALSTEVAGMTGASKAAFDSVSTAANGAIFNVVDAINTISKIDETQSVFQTISIVSDQVKVATQNATLNLSDATNSVNELSNSSSSFPGNPGLSDNGVSPLEIFLSTSLSILSGPSYSICSCTAFRILLVKDIVQCQTSSGVIIMVQYRVKTKSRI